MTPDRSAGFYIDVQGAETKVLRGAEPLVQQVDWISLEVNFAEVYQGARQIEAIDDWLTARGFRRLEFRSPFYPTWGDALYRRERP